MKWHGVVGFAVQEEYDPENHPSVYKNAITERKYYGDVLQNSRRWATAQTLNDNLEVNTRISIISDSYLTDHIGNIVYIEWMKSKWKVTNADYKYPRIDLTLGGVYNGKTS